MALDWIEALEDAGGSGNLATKGDCIREDEAEAVVGETRAAGPEGWAAEFLPLSLRIEASSALSLPGAPATASFAAPTDALKRLYKPLNPPCTISPANALASPLLPGRGGVKSSKVVRASEREAAVCR